MAAVSGIPVNYSVPAYEWSQYDFAPASGLDPINPGDYVAFSGANIHSVRSAVGWQKASGGGIAVDRNPTYDQRGVQVNNSALIFARVGRFRVSANFSGRPNLGVLAFPETTGSGVNSPSGFSGLGALWQTALPHSISGNPTGAQSRAVAQVVQWYPAGNGGTGQMDIWLWDRNADYF